MILKILDVNKNGIMDYKGLDIGFFIAGSQFYYKEDGIENCLVKTDEDLTQFTHSDVIEITEEEYWNIIENYKPEKPKPTEEEKKIAQLERDKEITMKALIELHTKILALESEK